MQRLPQFGIFFNTREEIDPIRLGHKISRYLNIYPESFPEEAVTAECVEYGSISFTALLTGSENLRTHG